MLQLRDLRSRMARLEGLMRGLAREVALGREASDPLLYRKGRLYLPGIQGARAGAETARAARRMEGT